MATQRQRIRSILTASVITAAFLGPGTVTTASRAGASYGMALLWALAFSTVACWILQEAVARMRCLTGRNLGQLLQEFDAAPGLRACFVYIPLAAIVVGCAAYEAGNILGGVTGASMIFDTSPRLLTLVCATAAALLMGFGTTRTVVLTMGGLVALMSVAFLATAILIRPPVGEILGGLLRPTLPQGSLLLVLALVGTTVVPYNLFLGSSLAADQDLSATRWGLALTIGLGGALSMAVLVTGSAIQGAFAFDALADVLQDRLGPGGKILFGLGLLGAGFSSAITAPLAAAITARSLLDRGRDGDERWSERSWRYRATWMGVLIVGAGFGIAEVRPAPLIVAAQALNGVLLPLIAVLVWILVNDANRLGPDGVNGRWANVATGCVVAVTLALGALGIARSLGLI